MTANSLIKSIQSLEELESMAKEILDQFSDYKVYIFNGQLGAGKTTFIKELCKQLGVEANMSSPTFGLVNEYPLPDGTNIFHLDCYRLESEEEAWDIGLEEIIDGYSYCFIEWPDKIDNLLPQNYVRVDITLEETERTFNFTAT